MNLLIINYEYPPLGGGASNASGFMAKALSRQGHSVSVLTGAFGDLRGRAQEDDVVVYRVPAIRRAIDRSNPLEMASFVASGIWRLPTIIRQERIEAVIVFFTIPCGPLGYLAKKFYGLPYVVSLRGGDVPGLVPEISWMHRLLGPLRRGILRNAEAVVANAPGLAELSRRTDPALVTTIPNGVDTDFFRPGVKVGDVPGTERRPFRLIFAGRLHNQKNLIFLFEQLAILAEKGLSFSLEISGDGPERLRLEKRATALNLHDRIVWHGWLDKAALRSLYQMGDCMVNPSLYEGMPNTVLEAMACGLPVIASRIPGNTDVVQDGLTGYLFDLAAPEQFRACLEKLIGTPELAQRMGQKARARVMAEFSWEDVARRYALLFSPSRIPNNAI
ncbi:MAG: glycosyltransferase family 4 protein [Nitrospira sp.]|nr:glycosyltransferase family 4 protein [Nitrospira sp.]